VLPIGMPENKVKWLKTGVGVAVVTAAAFLIYKVVNPENNLLRGGRPAN